MKMRWLGTNGFEFIYQEKSFLLDPFVTRRMDIVCDPESVSRYIDKTDVIFIGHSHWDHLADTPEIAKRTDAVIVGSETTVNICKAMGVKSSQLRVFKADDLLEYGDLNVYVLPSLHKQPMLYPGMYNDVPEKIDRIEDFLEGGTFALLFDFKGLRILNLGSANFIPEALAGLSCDYLLVGISGRSPVFVSELMRHVSTQVVIPTHFDFFDTPLEEAGERISLADFQKEMKEVAPDVAVHIPSPLEWIELTGENQCM